jgi:hypothetical protein
MYTRCIWATYGRPFCRSCVAHGLANLKHLVREFLSRHLIPVGGVKPLHQCNTTKCEANVNHHGRPGTQISSNPMDVSVSREAKRVSRISNTVECFFFSSLGQKVGFALVLSCSRALVLSCSRGPQLLLALHGAWHRFWDPVVIDGFTCERNVPWCDWIATLSPMRIISHWRGDDDDDHDGEYENRN